MSHAPPPVPSGGPPAAAPPSLPVSAAPSRSTASPRFFIDGAIAAALCLALFVIYALNLGTSNERSGNGGEAEVTVSQERQSIGTQVVEQPRKLRIAVTEPPENDNEETSWTQFDDMGRLLNRLGDGYEYTAIELDDLRDEEKLSEFDVVFITCGTSPKSWLGRPIGESGGRNTTSFEVRSDVQRELRSALKKFLDGGGTLYASDWRFRTLGIAFSQDGIFDAGLLKEGDEQHLDAEIADADLQEFLGARTIRLDFDQSHWLPAAFNDEKLKVYLRGKYKTVLGHETVAPLLVQLPYGEGSIIFTAFHNEKQNSEIELELLKYLVFTTVTARVETQITKTMVQGGFSPQKQNLLSASKTATSVTQKYTCDKDGTLRFLLGFENQGARLKLSVESPDGKTTEKEGASTFSIEIPDPKRGEWTYTVKALEVPFDDFPFRLQVWQQ